MKNKLFYLTMSVVCLVVVVCFAHGAASQDYEDIGVFIDPRYRVPYPPRYFETGGPKVKYVPQRHLRMGIVVRNRTDMHMQYIIDAVFQTAPLDRYRDFFVFANAEEALREVRLNNQFITTYDSNGRRIGGGFDWTSMKVRAGLVVLDVNDYEWKRSGSLGYAFKQTAVTQKSTILHELGHVLGDLGDEYSVGQQEQQEALDNLLRSLGKEYAYRMGRGWNQVKANLEYRTRDYFKWTPLVKQGFLVDGLYKRVEIKDEHDVGRFAIPSAKCVMNHPEKSEGKFCPVCQLQLIDKIAQFTGCNTPWDDYY